MIKIINKIFKYFLILLTKVILKKYSPKIVLLCGNTGKTTTKEILYSILSKYFYVSKNNEKVGDLNLIATVLKTKFSEENLLNIFLNILKALELLVFKEKYPQWILLEINVRKPKEWENLKFWLKADFVVFGRFSQVPSYIEFFPSLEALIEEKSKAINLLKKNGVLLLNADDEKTLFLKNRSRYETITFGFNKDANFVLSDFKILYEKNILKGITFRINFEGNSLPVFIDGTLGKEYTYASLVTVIITNKLNINIIEVIQFLKEIKPQPGHMKILRGVKESIIIDDSFNSSPLPCQEALEIFKEVKANKKIAILGDMLTLGKHTEEEHKKIGKIVGHFVDILLTVGPRASYGIVEGAMDAGLSEENIFQFENAREAGKFCEKLIEKGTIILIKGASALKMENAVAEIMAHPEKQEELLVKR